MSFGWDDDDPVVRQALDEQLRAVVLEEVVTSAMRRDPLTAELLCRWHALILDPVDVDPPDAAGGLRHPDWCPGEVIVEGAYGVATANVAEAVADFEATFGPPIEALDEAIQVGTPPDSQEATEAVLKLAADLHGEWVRIHPFVNGNGRVSRLLLNWTLIRYGLPPLVRPTPRPAWGPHHNDLARDRYDYAAVASMTLGNHRPMFGELRARLRRGLTA